jgi:hypothetical protein
MSLDWTEDEEKEWSETAPAQGPSAVKGKQNITCLSAGFSLSKNGNKMLTMNLRVDDGPFAGQLLWKRQVISTKQNKAHLKKDLTTAGIPLPTALAEVEAACAQFAGKRLLVTVKPTDNGAEIYIDKLLPALPADSAATAPAPNSDPDLPF